jgi:RNase P subunit RPR2
MSESLVVHCEDCGATKRFEGKDTLKRRLTGERPDTA